MTSLPSSRGSRALGFFFWLALPFSKHDFQTWKMAFRLVASNSKEGERQRVMASGRVSDPAQNVTHAGVWITIIWLQLIAKSNGKWGPAVCPKRQDRNRFHKHPANFCHIHNFRKNKGSSLKQCLWNSDYFQQTWLPPFSSLCPNLCLQAARQCFISNDKQ